MKKLWSIRTQMRAYTIFIITCGITVIAVPIYSINSSSKIIKESKKNIYVLKNNNRLVNAVSTDLNNSYDILAKGQIEDINKLIFEQIPDPKNINSRLKRAIKIGDKSVANMIDALKTNRYYNNIIDKNYFTLVSSDSINVNYSFTPHVFTYYGKIKIIRDGETYLRKIVTQGKIEYSGIKTEDDNRGYLIKNMKTIQFQRVEN